MGMIDVHLPDMEATTDATRVTARRMTTDQKFKWMQCEEVVWLLQGAQACEQRRFPRLRLNPPTMKVTMRSL
jgi:hypothetical protein